MVFFFFFQAEDGIRDLTVTGVQTCALPISFRRAKLDVATAMLIAESVAHLWVGAQTPIRGEGDRKSTRLNSSHSQISYAVFCLKKKKQQERPGRPPPIGRDRYL